MDYKDILNSLPVLAYIKEPNATKIIFYNKAWYEYTGFTEDEVHESWVGAVHPDDVETTLEIQMQAARDKKPYSMEVRIFSRITNSYRWFLAKCAPVCENDEVIVWAGILIDIHDSKMSLHDLDVMYKKKIAERLLSLQKIEEEMKEYKENM